MGRRRVLKIPKEHVAQETFLALIKTGAILAVAFTAPNALRVFAPFVKKSPWEPYYPSSLQRQTMKLWRKGLIDLKETAEGTVVVLTYRGKTETLKYDIESMEIPRQSPWDGRWRMVLFDIPSGNETLRKLFRDKLKAMGFFQMQKSVYVHPFPCAKQIMYLREVYGIAHVVKLATVDSLENDEDLRRYFHIQK